MYLKNISEIKDLLQGEYSIKEGGVFFTEPPSDTELQPEEPRWTKWKKANRAYFKKQLEGEDKSKMILDVGVGGAPFREILERFKVLGIDFYPYLNALVVADLTAPLPFRNNSCDIILMSNVLEHIPNPAELLSECYRILKPNGYIIATVPFLVSIHRPPYDFHRYTNFMLERLLATAGFKEIQVESLSSPLYLYETMQRQFFNVLPKTFLSYFWRRLALLVFKIFHRYFVNIPSDNFYVQGYGFYARKL